MSSPEIPQKAKDLCAKLERLAEDRGRITEAYRALRHTEECIQAQQEEAARQQQMAMAQSLMQNADKMGEAAQEGSMMQQINDQLAGGMNGI